MIFLGIFLRGGGRQIQVCPRAPDTLATPLKCRADLNFEVDFEVNGAFGTIVTKWDLNVFG